MSKLKNPAIKLFGKTISAATHHHHHHHQSSSSTENRSTSGEDVMTSIQKGDPCNPTEEESVEHATTSTGSETIKTPEASSVSLSPKDTIREEQIESNASTEMMMKKPEYILSCPRCSSMDTKFCYYNNYNVKQPRHFCKNCQRFWTAGGTMRNVAVGSGRRKNKSNCPSNPDHTKHPELFPSAQGISCFSGNAVHFSSPVLQDTTFPSSFAINFYPANPYCISSAVPRTWRPAPLLSSSQSMSSANPTSPLGKHHINGSLLKSNTNGSDSDVESGTNRYFMPNKALKVDYRNDAATCSMRYSMDIKGNNKGSFMGSTHFKAFYPILHGKHHIADNSLILQANPAAFSRSMNFHELY